MSSTNDHNGFCRGNELGREAYRRGVKCAVGQDQVLMSFVSEKLAEIGGFSFNPERGSFLDSTFNGWSEGWTQERLLATVARSRPTAAPVSVVPTVTVSSTVRRIGGK